MITLYRIDGNELKPLTSSRLANEAMLQGWVADDPTRVGLNVLVIGREITAGNAGRIDILAINQEGDLSIIELKRDRTPRDVIAQVLDYASWAANLETGDIHEIAHRKLGRPLSEAFKDHFEGPLPEALNSSHNIVIVASEFDASSERIVKYLANEHGVAINTAFFTIFKEHDQQYLACNWLMDQEKVVERAERKRAAPWTGYYYVNAGHDEGVRSWDDMRKFGFIAAGYGRKYSEQLDRLSAGDPIYVYQKGHGYIGFGIVTAAPVVAKDFRVDGHALEPSELADQGVLHDANDAEIADYLVGVEWRKTVPLNEALTFAGVFANQNVVCKLTQPATIDFLAEHFGTAP